ncbi:putative ribonuclease H-like domain-containing protein, partial [Tanacetum coccineum]
MLGEVLVANGTLSGVTGVPGVSGVLPGVTGVKELQHFNLFLVSQICDKKNRVLFTETECLVLTKDFKLPDETQVLLKVPRKHNLYSFNLEDLARQGDLACLLAKATLDESTQWHRRLGHVNFKNMNKLVKGNLVRGLPPKLFQNDHTCVACNKGKQHKVSYKAKTVVSSFSEPLQMLHMDLFGPTSVRSISYKFYCLVITDAFSRFSWVFFLAKNDETVGILKEFIKLVENLLNKKVKVIRCDNGTEFKNRDLIEFCGSITDLLTKDFDGPSTNTYFISTFSTTNSSMAGLKYVFDHNKVGYLLKPNGSDDYHLMLDFLRGTSLRFLQMILGIQTANTTQYPAHKMTKKVFANMKIRFVGAHMPLLSAMLAGAAEDQGERPAEPANQPPILAPISSPVNVPNPPIIAPTTTSPPRKGTNIPPSDHDQPSSSRFNEPDGEPLTSTFIEDETAGGSFHESPPRSHEATPSVGQPSGVAEDPLTLTTLSSLVSKFMQKTTSLESELKDTKKTLGTAIITLVGRVKKLEGALKKRKRKPVISDSDDDAERVEKEIDMDSLPALENASLAEQQSSFVTPSKDNDSGESQEQDISYSTLAAAHILSQTKLHAERVAKSPTQGSSRSVKTYTRASKGSAFEDTSSRMDFSPNTVTPGGLTHSYANQDIPADIFVTPGNMAISTGSGTIPAGSEQVPPVSTSIDKGKAQLVDEPTPTQERTFKQSEDERLGWEAVERLHAQEQAELERQQEELLWQDELLACQLDQDFNIPAQQKKRQEEVQAAVMHYTDDDWIAIMAKIQANEELSRTLI